MEYSIATYFMLFIIYAVAGWICEVTLQLIQNINLQIEVFNRTILPNIWLWSSFNYTMLNTI